MAAFSRYLTERITGVFNPGRTPPSSNRESAIQREVASRFGLVSAPDAPEIIERLWDFAKAGYLDNPIPSLFKERLFVYLSRFCEVRYCIARHCAFLVGRGHSSGDPSVAVQSIEQAIKLLKTPPPWDRDHNVIVGGLEALPALIEWPAPESEGEDWLIAAAPLCCSWNRDEQIAPGVRCVRRSAAIVSST